ncbi:MAG: hypothetical protein QXW14_02120 [Candidatus Nitrosocaldus sp.]
MGKYVLKCRLCSSSSNSTAYFTSYESYERHVIEQHHDNLAYRFKPMIIEEETTDDDEEEE